MDDLGVYRPSTGEWHVRGSSGLELFVVEGGNRRAEVVPVPADYDGDGAADVASWRPTDGKWVVYTSSNGFQRTFDTLLGSSDSIPVPGDYDGDGDAEIAVFDRAGRWRVLGWVPVLFGLRGDIPVPGDYDGDGVDDFAVFRPSNGTWYVRGQLEARFGQAGDVPVPAASMRHEAWAGAGSPSPCVDAARCPGAPWRASAGVDLSSASDRPSHSAPQ